MTIYTAFTIGSDIAPILHWKLNGDGIDSIGSNNGSVYNVGYDLGKIGSAGSFTGSQSYIFSLYTTANPQTYSLSTWFKTSSASGGPIIALTPTQSGTESSYDRMIYVTTSGQVVFGNYSGAAQVVTSQSGLNNGSWHHALGTFTTASGIRLYVDGVLVGSNVNSRAQSMTGYWRVGRSKTAVWPGSIVTQYFTGLIDDVRVYNRVLTPYQVMSIYNNGSGTEENTSQILFDDTPDANITKVTSENNSTSTFNATFNNVNGQHNTDFEIGDEVKIYIDKDINPPTTLRLTGTIDDIDVSDMGQVKNNLVLIGRDYTSYLQNATVEPSVYTNLDSGSIAQAIVSEFCSGLSIGSIGLTGYTVQRVAFNHTPVYDALKQLADYTDSLFYVDEYKNVHFRSKSETASTTTLGSANVVSAKFTNSNMKMYNKVWVYGDRVLSTAPIISSTSNGAGSVITLDFKPFNIEVIKSGTGPVVKGAVFNQSTTPPSGTVYLVDYDGPSVIWVSGTDLGNNIPASGIISTVKYDRSLPIVKYIEELDSIELYGPSVKVIQDKNIKDPRTAVNIANAEISQNAYPKEQGTIKLQGIEPLNAGVTIPVYLPFHNVSGTYNIFQIDYKLNKINNLSEQIMTLKVGEKIPDITDKIKQNILDIKKIQAGDIDPTDIITRLLAFTGSAGFKVNSWSASTAPIGSDWYLGTPASANSFVGSPGSYWVGSHSITWTVNYSGGE